MRELSDAQLQRLFDKAVATIDVSPAPDALRDRLDTGGARSPGGRRTLVLIPVGIVIATVIAGGSYLLTRDDKSEGASVVAHDEASTSPSVTEPTDPHDSDEYECIGPDVFVDWGNSYASAEQALRGLATEPGQEIRLIDTQSPANDGSDAARGIVIDADGTVAKSATMTLAADGWTVTKITFCR